jgi:hypothetical protein
VSARFPNPIRNRMKALCSSTMSGNGLGDELASRVQGFYARVSGKTKVEAQLDYLSFLRTFCPFYGSTFYEVHVQYDDSPLEESASPPVLPMMASIGPLAITLMASSADGSPIVMRHAYKRMIKWISFPDKHIFTYWIIKPNVSLADIEDYQEEHENTGIKDLDTKKFCDCVYLVTSQVKELEYLVKSYVEAVGANVEPALPGAEDELLPPTLRKAGGVATHTSVSSPNRGVLQQQSQSQSQSQEKDKSEFKEKAKSRVSRIGLFFNALGGGGSGGNHISHDEDNDNSHTNHHHNNNHNQNAHAGSGMNQEDTGDDIYNDDVAGIGGSLFQSVYKNMGKGSSTNTNSSSSAGGKLGSVFAPVVQEDEEDSDAIKEEKIPPSIQYAASMSELKRMAEEQNFSDSSDGENDGEEEEDDDDDESDEDDEDEEDEEGNSGSENNNNEDSDADSSEELKDKKKKKDKKKSSKNNKNKNDQQEDGKSPSSMKAFKRASRILFGQFGTKQKKAEE